MAYGKIVADQIQHSSEGTVDTQYVVSGSAKAWADVSTVTSIGNSLNVASLTDDGGSAPNDYTIAYTSNMGSAKFSVTATIDASSGTPRVASVNNKSTSGFSLNIYVSNSPSTVTNNTADFAVHGDLA